MNTPVFPARDELLQAADACDDARGQLAGEDPGRGRAREILAAAARSCRDLAAALESDPTLATEPRASARLRPADLVAEIARQLRARLARADLVDDAGPDRRDDTEALASRLHALAVEAIATVPRADHDTVSGSRRISRARLAAEHDRVAEAAVALRAAVEAALRVPHPDPLAVSLAATAAQLERHHDDLAADPVAGADSEPPDPDLRAELAVAGELLTAEDAAPAWARPTIDAAAQWLHTAYTSPNTKKAHANALGIPRADQHLWRGAPTHRNAPEFPSPTAFFPWCAAAGIDPHTDMTREALRAWITAQDETGVAKTTQKARLGAVSAWYREMRYRGTTTFEPPAALPQEERDILGVSVPGPQTPTVPLTAGQIRALQAAAERYPGALRLRYRAVVAVLAAAGLRAEELCALNRGDVHRPGPGGDPALDIGGKGRKKRRVTLAGTALEMVDDYLADQDADVAAAPALPGQASTDTADRALFTTTSGARLQPQQVSDMLRYLARSLVRAADRTRSSTLRAQAAQLRPVAETLRPHSIRCAYALAADADGVPVRQISLDLGHSSVAVTEAYLERGRVARVLAETQNSKSGTAETATPPETRPGKENRGPGASGPPSAN